jgi:hypothetical protein
MLDRWDELATLVECDLAWLSPDKLKAIRLMGMQPIDAVDDLDVARIFLACFVIRGKTGEPFLEIFHELFTREEVVFRQQAAARQLMAFADTNVELITTTTVGAKEEIRPAPNEPVEASENAPNEANPAGPEPDRNDLAKFDAWNRKEERGQKPESGITRGELKATQTKNEPVQAEWGYREYQIAETVLVH